MKRSALERGQALVLVLLSLAVVLTLVLYILSRSVTDIATSSREEEAVRAFSAAEAGIEKALVIGTGGKGEIGNARFDANVTGVAENLADFNYPINLSAGDTAIVWFKSHDANGNLVCPCFTGNTLKVCWGKVGTSGSTDTTPAVEVSVFYQTPGGVYTIARSALDPNASRNPPNSFTAATNSVCTIAGEQYQFQKTLNFGTDFTPTVNTSGLLFARLRLLYNTDQNHQAGFNVAGGTLPSQGLMVDSTGSSGEANRRLEVFQGFSQVPPIFDNVLFSMGGLVHSQ